MKTDLFITDEELESYLDTKVIPTQAKALNRMGIHFTQPRGPNGKIKVLRTVFLGVVSGGGTEESSSTFFVSVPAQEK